MYQKEKKLSGFTEVLLPEGSSTFLLTFLLMPGPSHSTCRLLSGAFGEAARLSTSAHHYTFSLI